MGMTRIHAPSSAWVPDITRSGPRRGTEGPLSSARQAVVHRPGRSHAWGKDRMERGLIVVIGGVDTVDNPAGPRRPGHRACGRACGRRGERQGPGVGDASSSPGRRRPAQSVHRPAHTVVLRLGGRSRRVARTPTAVTRRRPSASLGVPGFPQARCGDGDSGDGSVLVPASFDDPQGCPHPVDLWTEGGRREIAADRGRRSRCGLRAHTRGEKPVDKQASPIQMAVYHRVSDRS